MKASFPRIFSFFLGYPAAPLNNVISQIANHSCHSLMLSGCLQRARWTQFSKCGVTLIFQSLSYLYGFTKLILNLSSKSVFLFSAVLVLFLVVSNYLLILYWCCLVLFFFFFLSLQFHVVVSLSSLLTLVFLNSCSCDIVL